MRGRGAKQTRTSTSGQQPTFRRTDRGQASDHGLKFRVVVMACAAAQDAEERRAVEGVDLLEVPLLLAERVRREEEDRLADGSAVAGHEVPQIDAGPIAERGK